ncbi:hypothetical protein CAC42_7051 [Sphaceloma murrayae]|uniref:Uncharacterized protein n=1 Tax=Sphaceloma murrayae TaxID=2082308 RepID=A0A2K1QQL0_9PEZI|nr:hypothetical protein CAC42_7051 [Sphaceloma murrayae]
MNSLGGMGGPPGQQHVMNAGTPGGSPPGNQADNKKRLNTYIYDYFLRSGMHKLARELLNSEEIDLPEKPSPNRKDVNGATDNDVDSKDDIPGRPSDLPKANVPSEVNTAFLLDWWSMFWEIWVSARSRGYSPTRQYLQHFQTKMANDRQRMMANPQMQNNMAAQRMMQNGVPNDMRQMMMKGNRPQTAAHLQQMRMQMAQQGQMQRDGSAMDMNGQQRPQTPGSGDNAPSPKRPRLDGGAFNGQMTPMGRGQTPGMPGQQMKPMQMPNPNGQPNTMQVYANSMRQQMQNAMDSNGQKGMQNPNGLPQGSPALDGNSEFFNANNIRGLQQAGGPANNSNHALQDYQMQLMLLEQQNKKRLLMARQEQDATVTNGPGGPMPGQQGYGAPAMSPSNSRTGPSPNPDDMKRGTPKMAPGGMPQPGMDSMQGRGSPAPGFDPSQMNPNLPPGFQGMKMPGGMMPNGQMMPAATSHPAFNAQMNGPMNPQQMEMMRQQAAGRPNGPWPQGPPQGMMQPQQPPNMTPVSRNMPPPPAPATGDGQVRTQPSSPSQGNAAPPTPSQSNKPNPKKKDAGKGSKASAVNKSGKKGATTDATPASEAGDQPPTPTPAPPITPTAPAQQFGKNGPQGNQPQQPGQQNVGANQGQPDMGAGPFGGSLDSGDLGFGGMDFGNLDGQDVLDNFDFDSFLNNNDENGAFPFDASMNFGGDGGLEAGGDV